MANKLPKKPSAPIDHSKIIMAIMAGISLGVAVTWIIMSQMTPLRIDLNQSRQECEKLSKSNVENLKKIKDLQLSNENIVRENTNLKNDIINKDKEIENNKKLSDLDNKKIQDKLNQKQKEIDNLNKVSKQGKKELEIITPPEKYFDRESTETIPNSEETAEHLNTFERHREINNPNDFDVWYVPIKESKSFFSGEINITLFNIDNIGEINAKVSSPGYQDMPINGFVGQSLIYNTKNEYNINIAKIYNNKNYSWVKFTIKKINQSGKGSGYGVSY